MYKAHSMARITGSVLVVAGLGLLLPLGYYWAQNKISTASAQSLTLPAVAPAPVAKPTTVYGHPVQLVVPSLSMDLAVADGSYDPATQAWAISLDKVHYALPTVLPNNAAGNTLLYGHYRKGVFLTLHTIEPGAEAYVVTDNGYRFVYAFDSSEAVKPTDTSVFSYDGAPRLTLQTCSGSYYQNRQMHYFHFVRYEKI